MIPPPRDIQCVQPVSFIQVIQYPAVSRAGPINVQATLSIFKHSINVGQISLEPSKATSSKKLSLHSVRVRVRVRVGWCLLTYLDQTVWLYALNTPIWAYGIAPNLSLIHI